MNQYVDYYGIFKHGYLAGSCATAESIALLASMVLQKWRDNFPGASERQALDGHSGDIVTWLADEVSNSS